MALTLSKYFKMKKYIFDPYDNIFPILFEAEKMRMLTQINKAIHIEHIGSTAVPGLGGKGIIDIAILAKKNEMAEISRALQNLGYEFRPSFSTSDRLYFVIFLPDPKKETRRYHIHLTHPGSPIWEELIGVRDYLKQHPDAVKEYEEIKKQAVQNHQEGKEYRKIKDPFLKKILSSLRKSNRG